MEDLLKLLKDSNASPVTGFGEVELKIKFVNHEIVYVEVIEKKTSIKIKKNFNL